MSAYLISCQMTTQMKTVNSPLFFSTHSHCMQTEIRPAFKKQTAEDHILFITFWLKLHFTPSTSLRYSQIYMSLFRLGASGILTIIFFEILFFIFLSKWLFHQRSSLLQSSVCAGKGRSGAGEGGAGWKEVVLSLFFFYFFSVFCAICFVVSNGVAASPGLTPYLITVFTPVADASSLWAAAWTLQSALTQSALQTTTVVQQAQVVVSSLSTTSQCPCLTTLAPSVTVAFSLLWLNVCLAVR